MSDMKARRGRPRLNEGSGAEDSRERLIRAGARLFGQHGFGGVSTTMIAEAADLTQPMVHYCFRSKELLWQGVVEHLGGMRASGSMVDSNVLVDLSPLARLKLLVGLRFQVNIAEPYLGMIVLQEALTESLRLNFVIDNYTRPAFEAMSRAAQTAMEAGAIRPVSLPNLATLFVSAGYLSFAFASISDQIPALGSHSRDAHGSMRETFIKVLFEGLSVHPSEASSARSAPVPPPEPERAPRDSSDPLERLIEAGGELFARNGFKTVSTGMIASRAGLTQSMVHYYFQSKEQFWKVVVERLVEQRREIFANMLAPNLSPLAQLKIFVRTLIATNARQPQFGRIFLQEALIGGERFKWLKEHYLSATFGNVEKIGRAAVAAGEMIPLPPGHLSNILVSTGYHLFGSQVVMRRLYDIDLQDDAAITSLSDDFITILFDGLQI